MLPWSWLIYTDAQSEICLSLSAQWLQFKPLRGQGIDWTKTFELAKECIWMDSAIENKCSMITSNKINLQKLHPGMWTSYQPIGQVSRLGHLDSIPHLLPFIMTQPQRSQQLSHYYSINIADISQDNWKNSILASFRLTQVFPQTKTGLLL